MEIEMSKPLKQVTKLPGKVLQETGIIPKPTAQMAGQQIATPVAPVTEPKTAPKTAVSLGGEDQMAATQQQTRRRRAAGVQTGGRGLTTTARTERKTLLGQ
jgi:hypothetical protein